MMSCGVGIRRNLYIRYDPPTLCKQVLDCYAARGGSAFGAYPQVGSLTNASALSLSSLGHRACPSPGADGSCAHARHRKVLFSLFLCNNLSSSLSSIFLLLLFPSSSPLSTFSPAVPRGARTLCTPRRAGRGPRRQSRSRGRGAPPASPPPRRRPQARRRRRRRWWWRRRRRRRWRW